MVARLERCSVSLAQKPKSALGRSAIEKGREGKVQRTDLDIAATVEKNIIGLDVTVNDVLLVKVLQALTGLDLLLASY